MNSDASGAYQGYSACAAGPDGRLLVVWEDARSGGNDIYMQRFSRDGSPLGTNVRVNDSISPEQFAPSVAADPTGVFWVVWQDFRASGYPQNGDIYLQRIRPDGSKVGANILVNDDGSLITQKEPEISTNGREVLVVWSDLRRGEWDIYGQRFDFNVSPLGFNSLFNDETNGAPQHAPQLTSLVDGRFAVVWYDTRGGDEDIYLQVMSAVGGSLGGSNLAVSVDASGARQRFPTVGNGPSDGFTVAWEDYRGGVYPAGARMYEQAFAASGTPLGANSRVDTASQDQFRPRYVSDAVGNRVLVWEQKSGLQTSLRQKKYSQRGDTSTASGSVGPDTAAGERTRPRVALGAGNIFYCWTDKRSGNFDVYLFGESFRFPTFLPFPAHLVFERPIRAPGVVLKDTVQVNAVGFVQRRIGFSGQPAWLAISPAVANTPARFEFTCDGVAAPLDTSVTVYALDLDDSLGREPVEVKVSTVRPELLAMPPSVLLDIRDGRSDSQAVVVSNRKPGPLDWQPLAPGAPWFVRRVATDTVWVGFLRNQRAVSVWEDTLWIVDTLATNSPMAVPLSADDGLIPPAPPYLVVTPPFVAWRSQTGHATHDSASILIAASYDTAISFRITDYPPWLYVSDTAAVVPALVTLRAGYDSIPFGVYQDTVWIEALEASNSPYALPIVFTADVVSSTHEGEAAARPIDFLVGRPNPFNGSVLIEWSNGEASEVTLEIFDLLGRLVLRRAILDSRFNWNPGIGAGSGPYLIRLTTPDQILSARLLYIK